MRELTRIFYAITLYYNNFGVAGTSRPINGTECVIAIAEMVLVNIYQVDLTHPVPNLPDKIFRGGREHYGQC